SFDVGFFAPRGARVRCGSLLGLLHSYTTGIQVSVVPKSMIVRHGDSPVRHGTGGILLCDLQESFASSFILKRMQQRYRAIKCRGNLRRARSRKLHRTDLLFAESMMVSFIAPRCANEQEEAGDQN